MNPRAQENFVYHRNDVVAKANARFCDEKTICVRAYSSRRPETCICKAPGALTAALWLAIGSARGGGQREQS
eukprot:8537944-Alexandrium_andersonii.AAC.1